MRIYSASSWKNEQAVKILAETLRKAGHEVYCFAEQGYGQHIFRWDNLPNYEGLDGITCLQTEDSRKAFNSDKWSLDWANCCVLFLPCGRDAHLEAGYIKGLGGKLFILGEFPKGEFSNMYHLADGLFYLTSEGVRQLLDALRGLDEKPSL